MPNTGIDDHFPLSDQGFLDAVQTTGASDLSCERAHVTAHKEAGGVFSAAGCGRRAQYTAAQNPNNLAVWYLEREVQATDGTFYRDSRYDDGNVSGKLDAARASGAHDLHCTQPIVSRAISEHVGRGYPSVLSLLADGCGQRAMYKVDAHTLLLVSIVKVDPPPIPPTAPAKP
jgi:hypothetical protein